MKGLCPECRQMHKPTDPCPAETDGAKMFDFDKAWFSILADDELTRARGKLSIHELRAIIRHCASAATHEDEKTLLLTVARILRARIFDMAPAYRDDDLAALNEALAPFDPIKAEPINEISGGAPAEQSA